MKKLFLFTMIFGVLFTSCQNEKNNPYAGFEKTKSGLYYKFHNQNAGDTPELMELIDLQIACFINDSSVIIPNNRMIMQMIEPLFLFDNR